jgi:hypothetical protein
MEIGSCDHEIWRTREPFGKIQFDSEGLRIEGATELSPRNQRP